LKSLAITVDRGFAKIGLVNTSRWRFLNRINAFQELLTG
jgi:hypothetical protein